MSVNFNPGVSFGPVNVDYKKTTSVEKQENYKTNRYTEKPKNDDTRGFLTRTNYTEAEIDILTAASILAKAKILMEQEKLAIPPEITMATKEAGKAYNRANATAFSVLDKAAETVVKFQNKNETGAGDEVLRKFSEIDEDGKQTVTEFGPDGKTERESEFKDGIPLKMTEFNDDGSVNIINFRKGKPEEYLEGFMETKEGEFKSKYMTFDNGKPSVYYENQADFAKGGSEAKASVTFNDEGGMKAYYRGFHCFEDYSSLIDLHLNYKNGEIIEYAERIEDGTVTGKHLIFEDGKWVDISKK